jgi:hypothetical protein
MRHKYVIAVAAALGVFLTAGVRAAVPDTLGYQGRLTNGGVAVNGNVTVTFRLYTLASGGAALWTEVQALPVTNGLYSAILGQSTAFPANLFNQPLWLGVSLDANPEMIPRQQLTATSYSLRAKSAASADTAGVAGALGASPTLCGAGQFAQGISVTGNALGCATPAATTAVTMGGDVTGSSGAATVARIQGRAVAATAPTTGQVLTYNGSQWAPGGIADSQLSANIVLASSAQTVTGVKNFNPGTGSVPFTVDATKSGTVTNLKAQYAAQADTATTATNAINAATATTATTATTAATANALSANALVQYGLVGVRPARTTTISIIDSATVGAHASVTLGSDGLPVISYYDQANSSLKVAHCGNAACSSGTTLATVDNAATVGNYTTITVGVDGFPSIAYYDLTNAQLKFARCIDVACATAITPTLPDPAVNAGTYASLTIGADNLPIIAYRDAGAGGGAVVTHCLDAACTVATRSVVDGTIGVGQYTSIVLGPDGLPLIAYRDPTAGTLKLARCGDNSCTNGTTLATVDAGGSYASLVLGADGLPLISYYDTINGHLKVAHCGNTACSAGNTLTTVDSGASVGQYTSVAIGADGLPVIAYYDAGIHDLKVAHCGDIACSAGTALVTVDAAGDVGQYASITLGTDGLPVIAYYDFTNRSLKVAKCANASCANYSGRR